MYLPQSTAVISQWGVWDYGRKIGRTAAAANSLAWAELSAVPDNELWLIDRIRVRSNSTARTDFALYVNEIDTNKENQLDGTYVGNFDVGDFASPHVIQPTEKLLLAWHSASTGSIGRYMVQYTVMRRSQGPG